MKPKCKHHNCSRASGKALGYCDAHYGRNRKGKPMDPPVRDHWATEEERFWAKVQKTESCWLWVGAAFNGYGIFRSDGKSQLAHRVLYRWAKGPIPEGVQLDHMCHRRSCVNPEHLRFADWETNGQNRASANRNSKSGIRGVYWNKERRGWFAAVTLGPNVIRRGPFNDIDAAEQSAVELRQKHMPFSILDRKEVS